MSKRTEHAGRCGLAKVQTLQNAAHGARATETMRRGDIERQRGSKALWRLSGTEVALGDIEGIVAYIVRENGRTARELNELIASIVEVRATQSGMGCPRASQARANGSSLTPSS